MTNAFQTVQEEYETLWDRQMVDVRAALAEGRVPERDNLLMPVGPETARLMHALVTGAGATRVLDLGTSFGYSALWLADAVRTTGGTVFSVDLSAEKQAHARSQLERVDLAQYVEFIQGEAVEVIGRLDGPFDFILLDLFAEAYIPSLDALLPKLADSAVILADNMLFPEFSAAEAAAYRAHVRSIAGMEAVLLPIGYGVDLARFSREKTR